MVWEEWGSWLLAAGIAVGIALAIIALTALTLHTIGRRAAWPKRLSEGTAWPFRWLMVLFALLVSSPLLPLEPNVLSGVRHLLVVLCIAAGTWLLSSLFLFAIGVGTRRGRLQENDSSQARSLRTQLQVLRRLGVVIIVLVGFGAILMTFDQVRAVGASVLASAGLASIVAGLAAQSLLGNLLAGVQLAFNEAIRVGDIVVVEGEYGRIQDLTLSYVVVEVWDLRTLVLPCTYFTTQPFENWTKLQHAIQGTVEFDLDWRVEVDRVRAEVERIVQKSEFWDGESFGLQVTDATGGFIRLRVVVSAVDAPTLWNLRCEVREELATWIRVETPEALPRQRVELAASAES